MVAGLPNPLVVPQQAKESPVLDFIDELTLKGNTLAPGLAEYEFQFPGMLIITEARPMLAPGMLIP